MEKIINSMENHSGSSIGSIVMGFILAIGNHVFGWLNQIQATSHWDTYSQAFITGALGAAAAFMTTRILRWADGLIKKRFFNKKAKKSE